MIFRKCTYLVLWILLWEIPMAFADTLKPEERVNVYSTNHCPYVCEPEKGVVFNVLRDFFNSEKIATSFNVQPWLRIIEMSKIKSSVDIKAPAIPEATPHLWFSSFPIAYDQFCLFTKKDSKWKYAGAKSLSKIHLAAVRGYVYQVVDAELMDYIQKQSQIKSNHKITLLHGQNVDLQGFKLLLSDRVDVFVSSKFVAKDVLSTKDWDAVRPQSCYTPNFYKIGVNTKSEHFKKLKKIIETKLKDNMLNKKYDYIYKMIDLDPQILRSEINKSIRINK